jgi:hypothetical protein
MLHKYYITQRNIMPTPTGTISVSQIDAELNVPNSNVNLGRSDVRTLAGVPSGPISMSNLRGKSNATNTMVAGDLGIGGVGYKAGQSGSMTPQTYSNFTIIEMAHDGNGTFSLTVNPQGIPRNAFTSFTMNGATYTSAGAYSFSNTFGNISQWSWPIINRLTPGVTYPINFS